MRWFKVMRQQKLLSLSLLLVTLSVGIVIGTLINTGVHAARPQVVAPDATPLVVPSAVQLGNEFTKLAKRLEPSVVYITADYTPKVAENPHAQGEEGEAQGGGGGGNGDDDGLDLFKRFFHNGPGGSGDLPQRAFKQEQSGTGFIVDKNGYIITNNHVIAKVDHIKVKLHGDDDTEYRARIIGTDPETDLAVIKIDPKGPLTPVSIGNSDAVQVGDWAVAIGSPFGLEASVTAGIVSALGRDIGGALQLQRFIQTDAAINPGNSGGPLLNIRGEVIGVNTMIATQSGGYQGIGFALPINMVARVYNDIIRTGRVTRGSIGIEWTKGDDKPELFKGLGTAPGVLIRSVHKGGPAEKAGLKPDDIIIAMNNKPVKNGDDLVARVSETPVGSNISVTVDRDTKRMEFNLTVLDRAEVFKDDPRFAALREEEPPVETQVKPEEAQQYKFGVKLHALTDSERTSMGLDAKGGLLVESVDDDSFADDIGLQEKDVILSINRQAVASVDDVRKIQATLKPGDAVALHVMRPTQSVRGRATQWNSTFLSGALPRY
ncbi:MAG TPA: Do family serine endopeptidase [Bryobacteraceae bacterium]|nr:Do family serine endopeptidase [Bryobacteraceae bacterium]